MDIFKIHVKKRNIHRLNTIIDTFVRYGFYELSDRLTYRITPKSNINKKIPYEVRIRQCFQELGPTFIKFGQILSTRTDIIPARLAEELSHLQDDTQPFASSTARQIFKKEIGLSVEDVFAHFDDTPIASASIGQVYRAQLKNGKDVIIKIQRPDIEENIYGDIDIMFAIARFLDRSEKSGPLKYTDIVQELSNGILGELDYNQEGRNNERFRQLFNDDDSVHIPVVYWDFSARRVLTMETIPGIPVKDQERLKDEGYDIKHIANLIAFSFMKQVFIFGYFHGDPHPSNIMVLSNNEIAYIDFGIVGSLDKNLIKFVRKLFISFVNQDVDLVLDGLDDIRAIDSSTDYEGFSRALNRLFDKLYAGSLENIDMEAVLTDFMSIIYKYEVNLPPDFTLLVKAAITIEGVGIGLDPEFNLSDASSRFFEENFFDIYDYRSTIRDKIGGVKESLNSMVKIPIYVSKLLRRIKNNDIDFKIRFIETQKLRDDINYAFNKLSLSILVAALSITSAMFMQVDIGPYIFGMPFGGFITFTITVILGLWLLISVIFHKPK
jgi:ubiquinone biosynthesis protein